ncbi:OmpA family protein [Pseudodesulfovibrio cashew]|uniref:OmpA family protein n=1 Tax=Pseudodesulfovibrio cashew TaxID=2678688 RepID=A0A6I6JKZ9_9BACT|nr:OmpA family protein [Pseudodesulfovibrio cashew]QGY40807.1 OmpA family protein [Pseudodesulfovibrio cashew]
MKKAILFALLMAMTACANVDLSLTDQIKVYSESPVRKSSLQVSVHPKGKQYRPLTAYFPPFIIQQDNSDFNTLGTEFARTFHDVWTQERLFPTQEFSSTPDYPGLSASLQKARLRGADLLILGSVPYFYAGSNVDDTAITIRIDIYAAGNGMLLWTMLQSGRIEFRQPDDYVYFVHEFRMPDGPFNKLIRSIAMDMAIPLKGWLPDPEEQYPFVENTGEMKAGLTKPSSAPSASGQAGQPEGGQPLSGGDGAGMERNLPAEQTGGQAEKQGDPGITPRPDINGVNLDIHFDFDKATIAKQSHPRLDALGEALNSPELKGKRIIIAGHTDASGTETYNLTLSKQRADAVKRYLVEKWSISPDQIETVGYGKSRPIASGISPEAMQKNRRVEIRLAQ